MAVYCRTGVIVRAQVLDFAASCMEQFRSEGPATSSYSRKLSGRAEGEQRVAEKPCIHDAYTLILCLYSQQFCCR